MPFSPQKTLTSSKIKPARYPERAHTQTIRLAGGLTLFAGQVLEEVNTPAQSAVQTVTVTGSPTGGTFALGYPSVDGGFDVTTPIAEAASAASLQTALQAVLGVNNVTVTGSAGGPWTLTYGNELENRALPLPSLVSNALTGGTAPTVTFATTTPGSPGPVGYFQPYAEGVARCVLESNTRTAVNGSVIDEFGATQNLTAVAFVSGEFNASDLIGLDATAIPSDGTPGTLGKLKSGAAITSPGAIVEIQ